MLDDTVVLQVRASQWLKQSEEVSDCMVVYSLSVQYRVCSTARYTVQFSTRHLTKRAPRACCLHKCGSSRTVNLCNMYILLQVTGEQLLCMFL